MYSITFARTPAVDKDDVEHFYGIVAFLYLYRTTLYSKYSGIRQDACGRQGWQARGGQGGGEVIYYNIL